MNIIVKDTKVRIITNGKMSRWYHDYELGCIRDLIEAAFELDTLIEEREKYIKEVP